MGWRREPCRRAAILLLALIAPALSGSAGDSDLPAQLHDLEMLSPHSGWPVWLKDYHTSTRTFETSAITYLGRDREMRRCFFLADDVGVLHFCRIAQKGDTGRVDLRLEPVRFHPQFFDSVGDVERWDFEALALDLPPVAVRDAPIPDSLTGFLSIEGHGPDFLDQMRILHIRLTREDEDADWVLESLGDAIPDAHFWDAAARSNRGMEGLAVTEQMLFLGLESLEARGDLNLKGSVLYLYDRQAGTVAQLHTYPFRIHSICGMAAVADSVIVLVDRNRHSIFVLRMRAGEPGRLRASYQVPLDLPAPDGFRYGVPSVEGLAVDDVGDFWCVTDPWKGHYRPMGAAPESLHVYLAAEMPMIYRFPGGPVWEAAGLSDLWRKR